MATVPVTGLLRPFNWLFDLVRGTTGLALISIKQRHFIAEAKAIAALTNTDLFGPQDSFVEAVTRFVQAPQQAEMSASGIFLFNIFVERTLHTRKKVIQYIQSHQEDIEQVCSIPTSRSPQKL